MIFSRQKCLIVSFGLVLFTTISLLAMEPPSSNKSVQKTKLTVVVPEKSEKAYGIAGEIFCEYWEKVTGTRPSLVKDDGTRPAGNIVVIGSDAVSQIPHNLIKDGFLERFNIRYATDDYHVVSVKENDANVLILAGGSGRATIYAIYDFFRRYGGVEYFWDGDVFHKKGSIEIEQINFHDTPRFEYRGLRYFAHRGLHRFRAEQWNLEDWKQEIDWILKKRFNIFMLRTGIDDLFQRTFPGQVPYPPEDALDPDGVHKSYKQRTSPWPLKYRGDLREQVLAYAFDRGLLHPADCGTITHWYSHTPSSFYKSYPDFPVENKQTAGYFQPTELVWDIEYQRTWDTYWNLTKTSIKEYGDEQARMFHTIGLAERMFGKDRRANFQLKLYGLRKTEQMVRKDYPDAPLLIGGWDFLWWTDNEIRTYLNDLDPEKTIIMDYTDDMAHRKTYRNWTYKTFPWIFGLLHSFAGNTEIRGNYDLLSERLQEANEDSYCKGLIYWPELSHSDTFVLEYLALNSWSPQVLEPGYAIWHFCKTRYPGDIALTMNDLWNDFLPISQTSYWGKRWKKNYEGRTPGFSRLDRTVLTDLNEDKLAYFSKHSQLYKKALHRGPGVLTGLAQLCKNNYENLFWRRDAIDIARTIIDRAIATNSMELAVAMEAWRQGTEQAEQVYALEKGSVDLMKALAQILGESDEFSLYNSMEKLKATHPVNPFTEDILKSNSENSYCRHHVYEMAAYLYPKELEAFNDWVNERIEQGDRSEWKRPKKFNDIRTNLEDEYYQKSLKEMAPSQKRSAKSFAKTLKNVAQVLEQVNGL